MGKGVSLLNDCIFLIVFYTINDFLCVFLTETDSLQSAVLILGLQLSDFCEFDKCTRFFVVQANTH